MTLKFIVLCVSALRLWFSWMLKRFTNIQKNQLELPAQSCSDAVLCIFIWNSIFLAVFFDTNAQINICLFVPLSFMTSTIHYNRSQRHQLSSPFPYILKLSRMTLTKKQRSTKTKAVDANHLAVLAAAAKQAEAKKIATVSNAIPTCCPPLSCQRYCQQRYQ